MTIRCGFIKWLNRIFIGIVMILMGHLILTESALGGSGDLLWKTQFDKTGSTNWAEAITVMDNIVFITGNSGNSSGNNDAITIAYDARTGTRLWEAQFGKGKGNYFGYAIAIKNNRVFVTGKGINNFRHYDIVTLAYDARTGDRLWEAQFDKSGGNDWGRAIAIGDNTVFVTGRGANSSGKYDIVTLAYDAKTGEKLWEAQFNKSGGNADGNAIVAEGDNVFVTGKYTNALRNDDIVTLAYDAKTGEKLWEAQFDVAGGHDYGDAIAVGDNTVFVTGSGQGSSGKYDIVTLAYDGRTGEKLWSAQFDVAGGHDYGDAIAVGGNIVFVTGSGTDFTRKSDIVTLAYDVRTGRQLWEAQFDKTGSTDWGKAIAVKGNTVFVTGRCTNPSGNYDIVTLGYDASTGVQLWESYFDMAGGNDSGHAIVIGDNSIFVTGYGTNSSGHWEVVTLAYNIK